MFSLLNRLKLFYERLKTGFYYKGIDFKITYLMEMCFSITEFNTLMSADELPIADIILPQRCWCPKLGGGSWQI